jgi:hypothetical protein
LDPRLRLPWVVMADGILIAAFLGEGRAKQFEALGWRDKTPPRKIEVYCLDSGGSVCRAAAMEAALRELLAIQGDIIPGWNGGSRPSRARGKKQ